MKEESQGLGWRGMEERGEMRIGVENGRVKKEGGKRI